ncbi:helix-turn-helix transcriptional regulator [Legionella pneumophila serogroup 1]|uniref:helix-turn-helix domain-containing protein n=1 Tax=Legionella pneumophila TaxID=446 RepID=UPI0039C32240|nr:helix-turn-helix transcriptional regulator [Legionella pneumophila subsp. pneumophila]
MKFIDNIAKRLKIVRIASGYSTAKEFTTAFKIPASTYSQHENGKRALSLEHILFYAELLQINHVWLITGQGSPTGNERRISVEEKIYEEQEKLHASGEFDADEIPLISLDRQYSTVNTRLLKTIFQELLPLLKDVPKTRIEDVVIFCFELYNRVLTTNVNEQDKLKLIRSCLESFFNGLGIRVTDEILRNIAVAV